MEILRTISGDEFDKVSFKDNFSKEGAAQNWTKTIGDNGYDFYTNSGDLSVQVKVEQPISDGITN